jgi:hypothetical protein
MLSLSCRVGEELRAVQKSMLALSGKTWARSAAVWAAFAISVGSLAQPGVDDSTNDEVWQYQATATKLSEALRRSLTEGTAQVAKVEVRPFDLSAMSTVAFGDTDETAGLQ